MANRFENRRNGGESDKEYRRTVNFFPPGSGHNSSKFLIKLMSDKVVTLDREALIAEIDRHREEGGPASGHARR